MFELRKKYYNGIQIVDVLNRHIDRPETIMNCLNNFSNLEVDDAVEVVRCKDCKWYKEGKYFAPTKFCFRLKDEKGEEVGYNFASDDFCSYGERREG